MLRKDEYRNAEGAVHGQPPPMLKEVRKDDMADIVNHITFGTDDASLAVFRFMLHEVRAEGQPLGSIDFNKLIPMPQELDMRAGFVTRLGRMVFQGGQAVEVDIPQEPAALAQAMSAGIWRFQAEMECPASPVRNSQKKTDHRRAEG